MNPLKRFPCSSLLALLLLLIFVPSAAGQGLIIGPDARPVALELQRHAVDAIIREHVAVVTVEHVFVNTGRATVEGTFLFPLPPEAQVSDFSMTVDGTKMAGELLSAEEARRIYEDIVRRSLDPALLEMADYRTFRARVFPIPPGASRTITLRYDNTLPKDGQIATFKYPLQGDLSWRAAGRPIPPRPMPRPTPMPRPIPRDGENVRPEHAPNRAHETLIRVDIATASGLRNVYSPSHAIDVRRPDDRRAEAVYEASGVLGGQDFVLYYSLDDADVGATLLAHRPYRDRAGYFLLLLDPPVDLDERRVPPQNIVFVLDTSGSMRDGKMEQAKAALRYCLENLGPRDRFGVVSFSTDVDTFRDELRPASDGDDAQYFVEQLEASGGTNINDALLTAARMLDGQDDGLIVFLTDGLPSVGVRDEAAIRVNMREAAGDDVRLFAFGVGYDVNTRLLDGLAATSGAFADYISPEETIDTRVRLFFDKVRHPVVTDLDLDFAGMEARATAPSALPNLYKGSGLIVAGRYARAGRGTVTLRGTLGGEPITRRYTFRFPEQEREQDFVARLWATRRVGQLLEEIRLHGENAELKEEVIALAKEFGLVTPYTSYLVQEEDMVAERVGRPGGTRRGRMDQMFDAAAPAMEAETGAGAVAASKQIREMQEAAQAAAPAPPAQTGVAHIQGQRLLQQADGGWLNPEVAEQKDKRVQIPFASEAYFTFLRLYPEALPFAQLGQKITFEFEGQVVEIGDEGAATMSEAALRKLFG